MRKPHRKISTRRFNSINPHTPEIVNNFCPVAVIKIKSSANSVSQTKLENGQWILTLDKLTDDNVTIKMECGAHIAWQHTMNYDDAKKVYNYYLKKWQLT